MRQSASFGHSSADIYQPVWAACWLERAADLCQIHSESAYPLTTVVIDTSDDSMQVGDGRCHVRFLLYLGLIISRLGSHPHPPAHSATGYSGNWPVSLTRTGGSMDRTRSGGLRGSMPSLMKHRHAARGSDGLVRCAGVLAPKSMVRLTICFRPSESRRGCHADTPSKAKDVGDPMRGS